MFNLATIISQVGYPALVVGLLLEGETVLVLGAFMAHRGYLNLPLVILCGCVVSFGADQFFFWMGRAKGSQFIEKRPAWKPRIEKARSLLGRNMDLLSLGVRFMYGLRTVLPFTIGMSGFDPKRFALFDFLSSALWALTFGLAGKFVGHLIEAIFKDFKRHEAITIVGVIIIAGAVWLYHSWLGRKQGTR
ncbi:MAG TPA: DedA family protein [Anaerolineales bacterium]|jgi:membrane protein DedA with SNARE-associated domain|nr:DedA family protein [Anaerolineales bacterium]